MIFTTYWFFAFALLVSVVFWALPWPLARKYFLAAACMVFHTHFAGPAGVAPIAVMALITYVAGLSRARWALSTAMVLNIAALAFYKYTTFIISVAVATWSPSLAEAMEPKVSTFLPELPPLGVSFFAFEFVHYLFEVRRGGKEIRHPLDFVLFSVFFPSLVAGPIKRYRQFLDSLSEACQRVYLSDVAHGLRRIGIGFVKKLVVADSLTFFIEHNGPAYAEMPLGIRWLFVITIGFRILMDFSGYSDIAIGTARLIGVRLPENFNWPYLARSIGDFWQRWHMSLSFWIRDYVYIPLGGNRHGIVRKIANGLIAFALCGLWHGPAGHFVLWGVFHGLGLGIMSSYRRIPVVGPALGTVFDRVPFLGWLVTQLFVFLGWLWFFYPVDQAWTMIKLLFVS